ncbi:MAG TPA: PadR family transcriptional regulator [Ktedonobacterales bacterium]|jgi:PadR family transcriptional regulator AphA
MARIQADREDGYPITYAVLGLLAEWGPMSGYDLKRWFDRGLGVIWSAAHSQIYTELRRLTDFGWVMMEREEQEQRPDRKVYTVTPSGRDALAAWQRRPAAPPQIRDEFLLKLALGRFAPPDALAASLRQMLAYHEQRLVEMHEEVRAHSEHAAVIMNTGAESERPADWYIALSARLGVAYEEAYIRWLGETLSLLEASDTPSTL